MKLLNAVIAAAALALAGAWAGPEAMKNLQQPQAGKAALPPRSLCLR